MCVCVCVGGCVCVCRVRVYCIFKRLLFDSTAHTIRLLFHCIAKVFISSLSFVASLPRIAWTLVYVVYIPPFFSSLHSSTDKHTLFLYLINVCFVAFSPLKLVVPHHGRFCVPWSRNFVAISEIHQIKWCVLQTLASTTILKKKKRYDGQSDAEHFMRMDHNKVRPNPILIQYTCSKCRLSSSHDWK